MKPSQQRSLFGGESASTKPKLPWACRILLVNLLLTMAVAAQSQIPILNPNFDDPTITADPYFFDQVPDDWAPYNLIPGDTSIYVYPALEGDDFAGIADGEQVGAVYAFEYLVEGVDPEERGMVQMLDQTFNDGDTYQLSVDVGYTNTFGVAPGFRVQLLAGDTVIKEHDSEIDGDLVAVGSMQLITVNYTYNAIHEDQLGQPLGIRLINRNKIDGECEVAFDNVSLTAELANPFADPGGPYYLGDPVATLSLDGSGSLPSGTGTITLYEWDLDNDGTFDVTGVTPAAVSYTDLRTLYGMVDGSNPITLRVTDSDAKTAEAVVNVELVTSTKYTGDNANRNDSWNDPARWDNGIPSGNLDVVLLNGKYALAWDDSTPTYTGNLTMLNNSRLDIGWTTQRLGPYNALGTPGISKVFMHPGSVIVCRMGLNPTFPEVQLAGNATIILGTSTQRGAEIDFDYPVGGPHQLKLVGNSRSTCKANFNTPNNFSSLLLEGSQDGLTVKANAFGSLGKGNVTIPTRTGNGNCYGILEINADNAMADTATLSIAGNGKVLRMNANDTIAAFVVDGASLPAGTYGGTSSAATTKLSWITGTGILTVAPPSIAYWDLNGPIAGAGSATPSGIWDATTTNWNDQDAGDGNEVPWLPGGSAVFSAGSDAVGQYVISVDGARDFSSVFLRSGIMDIADGGAGSLRLTNDGLVSSETEISSVSIPIIEDASARSLTLLTFGELQVSGDLSQTGGTSVVGGNVALSGDNSAATGSTTLSGGVLKVDTPASIPGTARNLSVELLGALRFGSGFDSSSIQTALNNRVVTGSSGVIAADENAAADFDFNTAGLSSAYFGSLNDLNYTGTLTPQGNAYRLAGLGGTLEMANPLSGSRTLRVRGQVELQSDNTYTGATTVTPYGSLNLLGSSDTSGITLNGSNVLRLGDDDSLGSGTLTISGGSLIEAIGTVVTTNPVAANADFGISGLGTLSLGPVTINNTRTIASSADGMTTIASIGRSDTANRLLTMDGTGDITVTGGVNLGGGGLLYQDGSGTTTIGGPSIFSRTYIRGGTLRMDGSQASTGITEIYAGTLQMGGESNGGIGTGIIDIRNGAARLQAVGGDRAIVNDIYLNNNIRFSGSHSLAIGGDMSDRGNHRTLTNTIIGGKSLSIGSLSISNNRNFTIAGSGDTTVLGSIANGGSSTSGRLIKNGAGTFTMNGSSNYTGTTAINAGKLVVNGSSGSGNHTIASGATLGGTGVIGGNTTLNAGATLEFEITPDAAGHDTLELASGKSLTLDASSIIKVTGVPQINTPYTLLSAPGGITVPTDSNTPPRVTLSLDIPDEPPIEWVAYVELVGGTDLVLTVTFTSFVPTPPAVDSIVSTGDDPSPDYIYDPITYTVTFNQDMNASTFDLGDFGYTGTAVATIDSVTETAPGVFDVVVTPSSPGTLTFEISSGAGLRSTAGDNLDTTTAIADDTELTISVPPNGVLSVTEGSFVSSGFTSGPFAPASKVYTLTNYGNASLNWTAANSEAWLSLDVTGGTLLAGESVDVTASIHSSANALPISPYYDVITFTNTTDGAGDTTRGAFLTVLGDPVDLTLVGLTQTYDGTPKVVTATTDPVGISYEVTYNGSTEAPTTGGTYEVVATITDPLYSGTAEGTLVIEKADQTITFDPMDPVGNNQSETELIATASSGLPVSFTSSDLSVATISGSTAVIVDVGTTTITAYQDGDENYNPAVSVLQDLEVSRAVPLAVPGGPYFVEIPGDFLLMDGGNSIASGEGETITLYEWDLNSNDNGGVFNADLTGVIPTPVSAEDLMNTYGMTSGASNVIRLKVTDSTAKTDIQSTTVYISAPLQWDGNAGGAGQPDGLSVVGGSWLSLEQWWTGSENVTYQTGNGAYSGSNVTFGNEGSASRVGIPAPIIVGSMTFNDYDGTYDIGTAGQSITINQGITKNVGQGNVQFTSPVILGGDQTWQNNSGTIQTYRHGSGTLDTNGYTLTIDGPGTTAWDWADITGAGAIVKNGSGFLNIRSGNNTFSGGLTLNDGTIMVQNFNWGSGNVTINNGVFPCYWSGNLYRPLGDGPGEFRITGGVSGFGAGSGITIRFNNNANYEVVWGDQYFNPEQFVVSYPGRGGSVNFDNKLDLNGADRTISSLYYDASRPDRGSGRFSRVISNSRTTPAGIIKVGPGLIHLNASNTFDGGVTIEDGTVQLGNVRGLGSTVGPLTVNSGLLNLYGQAVVTVGNLSGTGGTIANNRSSRTTEFVIGNGGGDGGNFQGVIANNTSGSGIVKLTKTGTGGITLSGANTYTGATAINEGKLIIDGSTAATNISVASGATLGGNGSLGGNATVADGGKLEFNISSDSGSHDPLDFAGGKGLTLSGASELTVTTSGGAAAGTYVLVSGGNNIAGAVPATINLPLNWQASVSISGNQLILEVTDAADNVAPTLAGASIVDDRSGASMLRNTLVAYTVTFNEEMDASTVTAADFGNAGTATISIGSVTPTGNSGQFLVEATPTSIGSLRLQVNAGAHLADLTGNSLDTTLAIVDDTTIAVLDSFTAPAVDLGRDQQFVGLQDIDWTPTAISTVAWYDASNLDSITDDGSGNVTNWNDLSGNGVHLSQTTVSRQPTTGGVINDINGLNALDFQVSSGSDSLIASSNISHDMVYVVAHSDGMGYDGRPSLLGAASGSRIYTVQFERNASKWVGGPYYVNGKYTSSSGNSEANDVIAAPTLIRRDASYSPHRVCVGADRQHQTRAFDGRIGEVIYLNRALASDLRNIEGYLMWKWGLEDKLPAGHPYKSEAPGTTEGTVNLSPTVIDNELVYTWSVISGPGPVYFSDPSSPNSSATFGETGTYVLRLTAFDGVSTGYDEITIDVVLDGDAPTLSPASIEDDRGGAPIATNNLVTYTLEFSEAMDINSFSAIDFDNAGTSEIEIGAITELSPTQFSVEVVPMTQGTLQLRVPEGATLTDSVGNALLIGPGGIADDTTILVNAGASNEAPVFLSDPITRADATEDADYGLLLETLAGTATDGNDDDNTLTFSKHSGPDWLVVGPTGALSGTPTNEDVGLNTFIVRVSDGTFILPVEATLNITVINTNDAPTFNSTPIVGADAREDDPYSGSLADHVSDVDADVDPESPEATLEFTKLGGPSWLSVALDGTLSGTPLVTDVADPAVFTIQVTDGQSAPIQTTLEITVNEANDPPVVNAGPDQTIGMTGTTWTPLALGPQAWYDAADEATVIQSGGLVEAWLDKSTNDRHAIQTSASNKPTTGNTMGGRNVINFSGSGQFLALDLDYLANASHSAFIVTKTTRYTNIYGAANAGQGSNSLHVGFIDGNRFRMNYWGNDWYGNINKSVFDVSGGNVLNYVWTSGSTKQIYANGVSQGSVGGAGVIQQPSGGGRLGTATTSSHQYYGGDIAEVIFFTGPVAQADRVILEGYLAHKWGLQDSLPSGHLYETQGPDQSEGTATMAGSATDEDSIPASLTYTWSMLSGPAEVVFDDASDPNTGVTFSQVGTYELRLTVSDGEDSDYDDVTITTVIDNEVPTLAATDIVDDRSGAPVNAGNTVTYTVTFSEAMDASTVTAADFGNAGTATVSIGSVSQTADPKEFLVEATPTTTGTLRLRVNEEADLTDLVGNALDTNSAIEDDTTITVNEPAYNQWAAGYAGLTDPSLDVDFDNAGLSTGLEWVLGGDPTDGSDDMGIVPVADVSGATHSTFTFRRSADAGADGNTTIEVEYGSDMTFGSTAVDGENGISFVETPDFYGGGIDRVVVTIPKVLAVGDKMFMRLKVTLGTP